MLMKNVNGKDIPMSDEEEAEIKKEWENNNIKLSKVNHINNRKSLYPSLSDQIDIIYKCFLHLKSNGLDIGNDANKWLNQIDDIKKSCPKQIN